MVALSRQRWNRILPLLPPMNTRADGKGRPAQTQKKVFEAVLWVLESGASWKQLPRALCPPPYRTCHRYFQRWVRAGVFRRLLEQVSDKGLRKADRAALEMFFIDGTFVPAKKGAP